MFPQIKQDISSQRLVRTNLQVTRTVDGVLHSTQTYPEIKYDFKLVFKNITLAEKEEILQHFITNRANSFEFIWDGDGQIYVVQYAKDPTEQPVNHLWDVVVELCQL